MELITERDMILNVVKNWEILYCGGEYGQDKLEILNKLRKLDLETTQAECVNKIIGNGSWTTIGCDECGKIVKTVVRLGQEPDYDGHTAWICPDCLRKAIKLIESGEKY
jgi:hypothetical protein